MTTVLVSILAAVSAFNPAMRGNVQDPYGPHDFPLVDGRSLVTEWRTHQPTCWLEGVPASVWLGGCAVLPFGSAGWFVVRDARLDGAQRAEILDVDPGSNELRVLWSSETTERVVPIGGEPGTLWFFADEVLIRAREDGSVRRFELGTGFTPAATFVFAQFPAGDAVRGSRLLAASFDASQRYGAIGSVPRDVAQIAVLDLERQETRPLGAAWAVTGVPLGETIYLPTLELSWAPTLLACARPGWGEHYVVTEDSEALIGSSSP